MEAPCAVEEEEKRILAIVPSSTPPVPFAISPSLTNETVIENKAAAMASNDSVSALASPAEASPAKPAATSPTALKGKVKTSPAVSAMASASDSLTNKEPNPVSPPPLLMPLPCTVFGDSNNEKNFPSVLTFKGVTVTLENNSVWKQFYSCGTEMILTKQGRRMFPYCRYRLSGLDPDLQYNLVLSVVPSDQYKYRWNSTRWEVTGPAENQCQSLIRAFPHHYSPCRGSEWMAGMVSFYRLKITNNALDQDGHMLLYSMHRYIPRLHVIPVPDGQVPTPDQPFVKGPESMTFTFPQTEFMAVTTYQNFRITQLKINHNPFAKGFRDDGNNFRLKRVATKAQPTAKPASQLPDLKPAEAIDVKEEAVDLSIKKQDVSASPSYDQETRLVLRPIMSKLASKDDPHVKVIRGKHALGELVLVQRTPTIEPKEENHPVSVTPKAISTTSTSPRSSLTSSPGYSKRRKRMNRRWANSRGREEKAAAAAPSAVLSPSLSVAMQPEVDDVEGLLFVSFASKEALEIHVRDKAASSLSSASPVPVSNHVQFKQTAAEIPETVDETISCLEAILLQDLQVLKHRQVIHPVLQEVGLRLNSLDPTKSIDLQYLGVCLPLPPTVHPHHSCNGLALFHADESLSFISRTGKTCDVTKIKGWKNKFSRSKETSSKCDEPQKDLSAFCSNILDEYLESEAQQISERAAAFSTSAEGSVAYQLPATSSSYVKTLDTALKHRNTTAKPPAWANKPCPLSHKPLLYSALVSPAPPLSISAASIRGEQLTSGQKQARPAAPARSPVATCGANAAFGSKDTPGSTNPVSQRFSTSAQSVSQKPAVSCGMTCRPPVISKLQLRLLELEKGVIKQGVSRTHLTPERLTVALSVILTAQMRLSQDMTIPSVPKHNSEDPKCGQEFCRLGCVCSSLQRPVRGTLHCRQPDCMFGCMCLKRNITKYLTMEESESETEPGRSITNVEHILQPFLGSRLNKLWNRATDGLDPEPLFTPKSAEILVSKVQTHTRGPRPKLPIREEDKGPVYKYFESMMTCARVRQFNSKPPPEVMDPEDLVMTPSVITATMQKNTQNRPKKYHRTLLTVKHEGKSSLGKQSVKTELRKQIEIQSACQWDKDSKMVLKALCIRMNQNRLSHRFSVGPYVICPLSKICVRKPSGSTVTYRVQISKPMKASDNEDDESDADEEKDTDISSDGEPNEEEEFSPDEEEQFNPGEEPEMLLGVTPFLSGVLPAGRLRAMKKPIGCRAVGLIQVNGKSYNQVRMLLGNIGSLHPANHLAAHITGRLHATPKLPNKPSQNADLTHEMNPPSTLHIKAAGTIVPSIITARKTTDLKTPKQPPVHSTLPDSLWKGFATLPKQPTTKPATTFFSNQSSSINSLQNSSASSSVSLTVSPSLKTPSFLAESGTCSFRIYPPSSQKAKGHSQNLLGVSLPGGFTLIQLPKPDPDGTFPQPEGMGNTTNMALMAKAQQQKEALFRLGLSPVNSDVAGLGLSSDHAHARAKDQLRGRSAAHGVSFELMRDENVPSDESDNANRKLEESNLDNTSEYLMSDSSDYCGDADEDEFVDVETVEEETREVMTIARMKEAVKEAVSRALKDPENSAKDFVFTEKLMYQRSSEEEKMGRSQSHHTVVERLRRCEQRFLFDKLKKVLKSDHQAPKLRLLTQALDEIQRLAVSAKCLEEEKRRLIHIQSVYLKEISLLSGKPVTLIRQKLLEICEKQKLREQMRMVLPPFFSHLLRKKSTLLHPDTHQAKSWLTPRSQAEQLAPPAQISVPQATSTPRNLHQAVEPEAKASAPPSRTEDQTGGPVASVQVPQNNQGIKNEQEIPRASSLVNLPNFKMEDQSQAPSVQVRNEPPPPVVKTEDGCPTTSVQVRNEPPPPVVKTEDGCPTTSVQVRNEPPPPVVKTEDGCPTTSVQVRNEPPPPAEILSAQPYTVPLIRSKTGRLILPSSLKPSSQGFYRLVIMNDNQKGERSSSSQTQKNQVRSLPEPVPPLDSGSSRTMEKVNVSSPFADKRIKLTNSAASGSTLSPLIKIVNLNKSIYSTQVALQPVEKSREGGSTQGFIKTMAASSFSRVPASPCGNISKVKNHSAPVKRPRGRPPKKKWRVGCPAAGARAQPKNTTPINRTPITQTGSSLSQSSQPVSSPVRQPDGMKSPNVRAKESPPGNVRAGDIATSRPLTRGALGKDFPSAKKRSWIDVEKELEQEFE
ncbi:hypothetical protein LDENG_00035930 [Lucifuga dentata]|nr:hypothetical protein LDENG_00035930 [Lucifuga dentata]